LESQLIADHCAFSDFENPVNIASGDTSKFDFCIFKSNGTAGLLCDNSNSIILHSVFYLNQGYGLLCDNYAQPQVTNNIFFQNSIHGVKCNNFSAPNIINNTFIDNLYYGIFLNLNSNPHFRNNIVYGNNKGGIVCEAASFPAINYNDVFFNNIDSVMVVNQQTMDTTWIIDSTGLNFDNCPSGVGDFDTTGIDVFHNFSLGPAFLNYVDFTLSGASPCIDAGDPSSQFNDYDGSRNDLGAFGGPLGDWMPPEFMDFIPPSFYGSFSTR
jgi:parallel beta-helix repeat protein